MENWKISCIANNTETGQAEQKFYNSPIDLNANYSHPLWEYDNCISQSTRSCLATFFAGTKEKEKAYALIAFILKHYTSIDNKFVRYKVSI
jgi:hypothetical protein